MNYYTNLSYANERLRGTIVNTRVGPAYVGNINRHGVAEVITLKDQKNVDIPFVDVDLTPVQLGYINIGKNCAFASRIPSRSWLQGLSRNNLHLTGGEVEIWPIWELHHTIENLYPTFNEARVLVNSGNKNSVAFSREFAVGKNQLFYCGRLVGDCSKIPYLSKNNIYLLERLEEHVN